MKKAIFLDRDGTINIDINGYVKNPKDFELYPFAAEAISIMNNMDFLVFIVTNQSGIARGYYSLKDLNEIHEKMNFLLKEKNATVDEIFFSPYHIKGKIEPYNISHEDRKPQIGMFKKAHEKYNFTIKNSYMIGDKYTDIAFGKKAGLITILVFTGLGKKEFLNDRKSWEYQPDFVMKDLIVAANLISKLESQK
ncbi:MAG: HAD family hydrolase [Armatimonadetes bacterium]|nr:HAD family hydrolase [Armatimonadota bacterium]